VTEAASGTKPMRGVRAGAVVFVGVAALNAGNYLFHLIAARRLGPERYGDLATLVAISGLISLPLGGVQVWVARYVAQYRAVGDQDAVHWFVRRVGGYLTVIATLGTAALLLLSWPIQHALGIASIAAVAITALTAFPSIVSPVTRGLAQGLERFGLTAVAYACGPVIRIGFTLFAFAIGLHVGGAMLATLLSMLVGLFLPLWVLREWVRPSPAAGRRINRAEAIRSLLPVVVGLLAITALTTDDVVVAKAALSEHSAGIYGTASLIGRVILYLPAAIITVLLPRVAARTAGNEETHDLLLKSVGVTAAFCTSLTLLYGVAAPTIVRLAFGSKYASASPLLWRFGVAMTGFAILNVLLVYHLGRGDSAMSWLLAAGAVLQLAAFALLHGSARQIVTVDVVFAAALVLAHEVVADRGVLRRKPH
jgi:O-antigen/teichoic acid export membrane protein